MDERNTLKHVTTSYASGFDGFCEDDDGKLFDSLDNGPRKEKIRLIWELLYRTVAYKLRFLEEYEKFQNNVIDFGDKNPFFYNIWALMFKDTPIETFYENKSVIEEGIQSVKYAINMLYDEINDIKKYYNTETDQFNKKMFRKDYCYKEIKDVKDNINFVGVNYILYYPDKPDAITAKLMNNLLVAQIPVKKLSSTQTNCQYDYCQIMICKKKSEDALYDLENQYGFKYIINYFLIHSPSSYENTFFKRTANENDKRAMNQEKLQLALYLSKTDFWKV